MTQVLLFIAILGVLGYAFFKPDVRERLVTNSWQPIPAILFLVLAAGSALRALDSVVHHRLWLIQAASVVLFAVAGVWQLVLLRRHGRFGQ